MFHSLAVVGEKVRSDRILYISKYTFTYLHRISKFISYFREARAGRDEAERIRSEAFCIKRAAELDCEKVRLDAKHLVQRGDMDAQQVEVLVIKS